MTTLLESVTQHERAFNVKRIRSGIAALRGYADAIERQLNSNLPTLVCAEARNAGQHLVDIAEAAGNLSTFDIVEQCFAREEAVVMVGDADPLPPPKAKRGKAKRGKGK
jgi:hypothetical protein